MPIVTFIRSNGETLQGRGDVGQSVMRVAVNEAIPGIIADCGGAATCATCHVHVDAAGRVLFEPLVLLDIERVGVEVLDDDDAGVAVEGDGAEVARFRGEVALDRVGNGHYK